MKCLSLKQPYAHLLASGKKTVELIQRPISIDTSLNIDEPACKRLDVNQESLTKGGIRGKAYLSEVQHYGTKREFQIDKKKHFAPTSFYDNGFKYGFLIKNAIMFNNPLPLSGKLRFFKVEP
jgi:hypothetical protein